MVSSFITHIFREIEYHQFSAASKHTGRKRLSNYKIERCAAQIIGFEPLIWESIGGTISEISSILDSLRRMADG